MQSFRRFLSDERGLETIEYAIMAGLIVSGLLALIVAIGGWTLARFKLIGRELHQT